jgi:hypothetical protein
MAINNFDYYYYLPPLHIKIFPELQNRESFDHVAMNYERGVCKALEYGLPPTVGNSFL